MKRHVMRWTLILFLFLMPVILLAGVFFRKDPSEEEKREYIPVDRFTYGFDKQMEKALIQRLPKKYPYIVKEFPVFYHHHWLTGYFDVNLQLPSLEMNTQEEAIKTAFPYARAYVDTLNNFRERRPYLFAFPVPLFSLDFVIQFWRDPKTHLPLPIPSISGLYFAQGSFKITQFTEDKSLQQSPACPHINIYPTPHTFPDIFLQLDQPQFDPIDGVAPIAIPEAQIYAYFNKSRKQEFRFCQETAHAHGLLFLAFENVFPRPKPEEFRVCSEIAYAAQEKKLSIDEIRKLVMQLKDRHLSFYIREKWIPNHVNIQRRKGNESLDETINAQKYISMRISFWDKYIDRVKPPHIAEIKVVGSKAKYYVSDELQRLQLVYEEELPPYEIEIPVPKELLKEKSQKAETEQH